MSFSMVLMMKQITNKIEKEVSWHQTILTEENQNSDLWFLQIIHKMKGNENNLLRHRACSLKLMLLFATHIELICVIIHAACISIHLFRALLMKWLQPVHKCMKCSCVKSFPYLRWSIHGLFLLHLSIHQNVLANPWCLQTIWPSVRHYCSKWFIVVRCSGIHR